MIRINLLPHKKVKPVEKGIIRLWIITVAVAAVLLGGIAVSYLLLSSEIGSITEQKAAVQQELAALKKKVEKVADYEKKRKDYETKLGIIAQIEKIKIPLTPALFELNRIVVKDIWVEDLKIKDAEFVIKFRSVKREGIEPFFSTMKKSKMFSNLVLKSDEAFSPKLAGSKSFPFTVTGQIAGYEKVTRPDVAVANAGANKGKDSKGKGTAPAKGKPKK